MIPFKKFLPGIAWFFIVLALICLPGDDLPHVDNWFKDIYGDKWIHCFLFGMLTCLFSWPVGKSGFSQQEKKNYFFRIALAACLWGLTTELIQKYFIPYRSFDLIDWAADSLGVLLAWWICYRRFLK